MDLSKIIELQRALTDPHGIWDNPQACATLEDLLKTDRFYEVGPDRNRAELKVTTHSMDASLGLGIKDCFAGFDEDGFSGFVDTYATFLHRTLRAAGEGAFHDQPLYDPSLREQTIVHAKALGPNQIDRQMAMSTPLEVGEGMLIAGYTNGANPDEGSSAFKWLEMLAPSFAAGRKLRYEIERYNTEWSLSMDALPVALLVFDCAGDLLHRNLRFDLAMSHHPGLEACQSVAAALARDLLGPTRRARYMENAPLEVTKTVKITATDVRLSATQAPWPFGNPVCIVSLEFSGEGAHFNLTKREIDVAGLLSQGMPDKEIARELSISQHTVRRHVERVLAKTGTHNRTEAALMLRQLLQPDSLHWTPRVRRQS